MCTCVRAVPSSSIGSRLGHLVFVSICTLYLWASKGIDHGQVPEKLIDYVHEG